MELGWLDVCLRVENVARSRSFYEDLGFHRVEGDDDEGWAVMVNGEARLGLFVPGFMESAYSLNFRGGDVRGIVEGLVAAGHSFVKELKVRPDGSGSALIEDPDGHRIFFDSAPGETKKI